MAIAEAGDGAQFRRAVEDFDGESVVRVGRLNPERQPRAWGESRDAGGTGGAAEAGDREGVLGEVQNSF